MKSIKKHHLQNRSILSSLLIKPAFEDPIDTEYDVLKRSVDVMVPGNTSLETLIKIDPRPSMKMLQKRVKLYKPEFALPSFVKEG